MNKEALEKAVSVLGGQTATAEYLKPFTDRNVKQQNIEYWLRKPKNFPAELVIPLEQGTIEKDEPVYRYEIAPHLYPKGEAAA